MRKFRRFFIGLGFIAGAFILYLIGVITYASLTDYEPLDL